ncbi:MAG: hypothetical protein PSV22_00205, partial [Pseudolabrys sp.]|nr:hypothetical protein [Pseudolabrys sp.]
MAITNKRIVTGTAGAGNVGTGADVTWPTTGNPSLANSGIYYTGAEGAGYVNITTAANRGDFLPWDTTNPKPAWATGSSFVRTPAAATGQIFVAMNNADCVALNSVAPSGGDAAAIDFENGILFTVGFRWYTDPATFSYLAGSLSPAHNPGALSMHEFQINGGTSLYQLRTNPYNVGGFKPSVLFSNGVYSPGVSTILDGKGGFSSAQPNAHIEFNEWHLLQVHVRRSTTDVANDGRIRVYIDGQLVMETTGADVWSTDGSRHGMFLGLLSGYSAARTGMRLDYCAPIKVQIVPESDLPTAIIQDWSA